jgi:3-methyladenine DNA glycosylase AlkD
VTLRVCAAMVREADPGVRKALAWALREASKHDPALVAGFLRRHRQALHPGVLREAAPGSR